MSCTVTGYFFVCTVVLRAARRSGYTKIQIYWFYDKKKIKYIIRSNILVGKSILKKNHVKNRTHFNEMSYASM